MFEQQFSLIFFTSITTGGTPRARKSPQPKRYPICRANFIIEPGCRTCALAPVRTCQQQSSAIRGKKTKTGTGDGLGPWACDTNAEAASRAPANALLRVPQNELPKFARDPGELHYRSHTTPFDPELGFGRHFYFLGNLPAPFYVANFRESCDSDATRSRAE